MRRRQFVHVVGSGALGLSLGRPAAAAGSPEPSAPTLQEPLFKATSRLMRLHDQGLLDVEAPVMEVLPDFQVGDAAATQDVRIWHLLTHTPGWEGQLGTPDRGPATLEHFIGTLRELPQLAFWEMGRRPPRSRAGPLQALSACSPGSP